KKTIVFQLIFQLQIGLKFCHRYGVFEELIIHWITLVSPDVANNTDDIWLSLKNEMRGFLFILALVLLVGWGIGVFFYALKGLFNIVVVLAAIAFIVAIFNRPRKA